MNIWTWFPYYPYYVYKEQRFADQEWAKWVLEVKDLMKQYGEPKEIWLTEVGWPTHKTEERTEMLQYTDEQQENIRQECI